MDNLAHTLAGSALAKVGLDRRTPLGLPTLLVAANLPDVDVLSYLRDPLFALTFRRGWTHGVLAMLVLPALLTAGMLAWDRQVRRRRRPDAVPAAPRELLLLSLIGVLSHPLLDLLNTYGVRLLMPFSGRWFYGDTLFIIDPWLWGLLALASGLGAVGSRRERPGLSGNGRRWTGMAQLVALAALAYIAGMYLAGRAAVVAASGEADAARLRPQAVMAAPVPVNPFRRAVLLDLGDKYHWAALDWRRAEPRLDSDGAAIPRNFELPAVSVALEQPEARAFLTWSRFPAAVVLPSGWVRLYDLRYAGGETDSWAAVAIPDRSTRARTSSSSGSPR